MELSLLLSLLGSAALGTAELPGYSSQGTLQLELSACSEDSPAELRGYRVHNQRLEVIDRYDQPFRVVKMTERYAVSGCAEGVSDAEAGFEVTAHARDDGQPGRTITMAAPGQAPEIVSGQDWDLLRATQSGCCGAADGYTYFRPNDGLQVAVASSEPLPLQLINRVPDSGGEQGTLWRWAFALGSTSIAFDHSVAANAGVLAELILAGPDRASARYAVRFESAPADDSELPGPWTVTQMRWTGAGLDEDGQTWWIDGAPPQPSQFDGMTLELELMCQCDAAPLSLSVPMRDDQFVVGQAKGRGLKLVAL